MIAEVDGEPVAAIFVFYVCGARVLRLWHVAQCPSRKDADLSLAMGSDEARQSEADAASMTCGARLKSSTKATRCGACIVSRKDLAAKWSARSAPGILRPVQALV
ncbi:MAG: hypothetical protein MZV64_24150 [Ignavibacteriales bacterium]|nr:hypothetical protein [Ignavibacteriales bacterium]